MLKENNIARYEVFTVMRNEIFFAAAAHASATRCRLLTRRYFCAADAADVADAMPFSPPHAYAAAPRRFYATPLPPVCRNISSNIDTPSFINIAVTARYEMSISSSQI